MRRIRKSRVAKLAAALVYLIAFAYDALSPVNPWDYRR